VGKTIGGGEAANSKNSKTAESMRIIGKSGLMAAATVLEAVSEARERVLEDGKTASAGVVEARYGEEAKDAYEMSLDSIINVQKVGTRELLHTIIPHDRLLHNNSTR
jgi:hypothetical protein